MNKYPKHTLKGHLKTALIALIFGLTAYGLTHVLFYFLDSYFGINRIWR